MRRLIGTGLMAALLAAGSPPALSDTRGQDLYLDAMQSLSEGRQNDASEALMRMVEQEPEHAGAWLDLAIIQCELGRTGEAERLFDLIEMKFNPPQVIRDVISHIRARGCKRWQPERHWSLSVGRGVDSNINQGATNPIFSFVGRGGVLENLELLPEYRPTRDQYTLLSGEYLRELDSNGTLGFMQGRFQKNDSLSRFDTLSVLFGVEKPWRFGSWAVRGTGILGFIGLGDALYQRQTQLQMRVTPPLDLPRNLQFNLVTGMSHVEYLSLSDYDANTWELRGVVSYRAGANHLQGSIGYLSDHPTGARPGGIRDGWLASLLYRRRFEYGITGELAWTRQTWNGHAAYSEILDRIRKQDAQIFRAGVTIPVNKANSVNVEFRNVNNNENISLFQYKSRQLQLTWQWQPF
jgi:hypothetical protein